MPAIMSLHLEGEGQETGHETCLLSVGDACYTVKVVQCFFFRIVHREKLYGSPQKLFWSETNRKRYPMNNAIAK